MSYATEQVKSGRRPVTIVEMLLDQCVHTYGVAPCTAAGASKCFNTRATCQDTANYSISSDILVYDPFTSVFGVASTGQAWTLAAGVSMGYDADGAYASAVAAPGLFASIDCGVVDYTLELALGAYNSPASYGPIFGYTDANNWWGVTLAGGAVYKLYKMQAGVLTLEATSAIAPGVADVFKITRTSSGGVFTVTINDTSAFSVTSAHGAAATKVGIGGGASDAGRFRSFRVYTGNGSGGTKTYRFSEANSDLPPTLGAIPSLVGMDLSPVRLNVDGGLGRRASIKLTFQDHPHHDRGIDPYVTTRSYTPETQGTFWGKFRTRNAYYQGRTLYVYTGYVADAGVDFPTDFQRRAYVIERIEGPNGKGQVTVTAKDVLKLADNDRAQAPRASGGRLSAALTDAATASLTLTPTGAGSETYADGLAHYPSTGGYVRIDGEIIKYGSRSGDVLSTLTRGRFNTTAAAHDADAAVQLCLVVTPNAANGKLSAGITSSSSSLTLSPAGIGSETFADGTAKYPAGGGTVRIGTEVITYGSRTSDTLNSLTRGQRNTTAAAHDASAAVLSVGPYIPDVLYTLLVTYGGLAVTYLPMDDWYAETNLWQSLHRLDAVIAEPTGVNDLITALTSECLAFMWWDDVNQEVKLKAIAPPTTPTSSLTDLESFIADSITIVDDPSKRLSQVWVFFDRINPTEADDAKNFGAANIQIDTDAESSAKYGARAVKVIKSKWFGGGNRGEAVTLASRTLNRRKENPRTFTFTLDAKDASLAPGDVVTITSAALQDEFGAAEATTIQIIERREVEAGHRVTYVAEDFYFSGRYCYIAPDAEADYSSASDADKALYSWICPDVGTFSDGTEAYKVI